MVASRPARLGRALGALAAAALLAGCQGRGPAGGRPPEPEGSGGAQATQARPRLRIAVVDLARATRAHPRWGELQALDNRIGDLQAQLAVPQSARFEPPRIDLGPQMKAEAARAVEQLRPEFRREMQQEVAALQDAARRELEAYAARVRADQQAQFDVKQKALEAQTTQAVDAKQQEIATDNEQYQEQVLQEYRLPLLNLRLKLEDVQQTDKQAADRLNAQMQALTKERDDKVAAHERANQQALGEFQRQQAQAYAAAVQDLLQQLTAKGRRLIDQKGAEINARLRAQVQAREAALNRDLNARLQSQLKARQEALVAGAREQLLRAQEQAQAASRARAQSLEAQLLAAQEERARLVASILADLRVEAAAVAQRQGYDVILTQTVAAVDAEDITDALIARLKR